MSREASTIEEFLTVLRKSGLVEASQVDAVAAPWKGATGPLPDALPEAFKKAGLLTDWHIRQLRKGKHRGYFLGQYKLRQELGKGGMSAVYLAEHTGMKMPVAIKVLPVKRVDEKSYLERFKREAQASFRLNHPNIARATNFDHSGDIWYIVLDYIEGIDLQKKVKEEGVLPVRQAVEYIRQAALGLQYAHDEGLVHRDIKPANLILDNKGTIKILDLGLALGSDDDEEGGLTKQHDEKVLGTADYLAPEQSKNSHAADPRSDIYSLGCTLYYLLIGRAPFAKGSVVERIKAHWNEPPPNPLDELEEPPPDLDSAVIDLYFRMLEKHPDARPQTAGEVADTIAAWLEQHAGDGPRPAGSLRRRTGDSGVASGSLLQSGQRRHPSSAAASGSNVLNSPTSKTGSSPRRNPGPAAKPAVARPIDDEDAEPLETLMLDEPVATNGDVATKKSSPPPTQPEEDDDEEDDDDFFTGGATKAAQRPAAKPAETEDDEDDEDDDDFLAGLGGAGSGSRPSSGGTDDDDDDDDFLATPRAQPATQTASGPGTAADTSPINAEDIPLSEWWDSTFLRLSMRTWRWIVVGVVILFVLSVATNETLKSMKTGKWGLYAEENAAKTSEASEPTEADSTKSVKPDADAGK
jgi:serine/threonine protein kinase